ncbi:MAG: hypothetical protein U0N82_05305 [Oscillospiraceae bacterium]
MKKLLAFVLAMVCVLSFVGCSKQPKVEKTTKALPVPEYPLSKESIETAMEQVDLPEGLVVEEATPHQAEGAKSTLYILRHPDAEIFDGICMEIISHKYADSDIPGLDNCIILGIGISSIDQNEAYTREEVEQAVRFATYLFWQDESDTRIYDIFIKEFDAFIENEEHYRKTHGASSPVIENEIDGVQYIVSYTPIDAQTKFKIRFQIPLSTNGN